MIEETIPSESPGVEESFARTELAGHVAEEMERFVAQITDEREQQIWHDRLISEDPLSLSELGRRFGVSRERVRQLEERLKRRFKEHLSEKIGEELILELTEDI